MTAPTEATPVRELTAQQIVLVESILLGMSPAAAARAAGYSDNTNTVSLLRAPAVVQALRAGRARSAQRVQVARDEVLQGLLDAVRASATATEMVMAWREIAKMQGYYAPEEKSIVISRPGAVRRSELEALPDAELMKMVGLDRNVIDADFTEVPSEETDDGPDQEA